eukprot:scaffold124897_cov33-Tisochrysis_lutea.AAC.2
MPKPVTSKGKSACRAARPRCQCKVHLSNALRVSIENNRCEKSLVCIDRDRNVGGRILANVLVRGYPVGTTQVLTHTLFGRRTDEQPFRRFKSSRISSTARCVKARYTSLCA